MNQTDMTALVSAFTRAYHAKANETKIFDDSLALPLLGEDYSAIARSMKESASFFASNFAGTAEEVLRHIADIHLSPSPLARSAFAERALENAVKIGAKQYILLDASNDTFVFRQSDWAKALTIFELDLPQSSQDKQRRIEACAWKRPENLHCIEADLNTAAWVASLVLHPAFSE